MTKATDSIWTRREMLGRIGAATGVGLFGLGSEAALAEPPPETTSIRLLFDPDLPILCYAPQYLAEEFLRLEGFTDIRYNGFGTATSDSGVLLHDRADISAGLGSDYIVAIDREEPLVVLSGMHAGCVETFARDRVESIRDLAGKRILSTADGGPEHIFLSSIVAFVGLDPARDVEWVWDADWGKWPDLLEQGKVDVVNAFPPMNLELRERKVGHVILNTTLDDPWRNFFCCMVAGRSDFVRRNPIATKRAIRALIKANQLCEMDNEGSARRLVEWGATDRYDFALKTLQEIPYGAWRDYDPRDTMRFFALRLREAGLIEKVPGDILERGTDFRFIDEIRREMKV